MRRRGSIGSESELENTEKKVTDLVNQTQNVLNPNQPIVSRENTEGTSNKRTYSTMMNSSKSADTEELDPELRALGEEEKTNTDKPKFDISPQLLQILNQRAQERRKVQITRTYNPFAGIGNNQPPPPPSSGTASSSVVS